VSQFKYVLKLYKRLEAPTLVIFYEKLLLLKRQNGTETGKKKLPWNVIEAHGISFLSFTPDGKGEVVAVSVYSFTD
jgi:hypothetical protein